MMGRASGDCIPGCQKKNFSWKWSKSGLLALYDTGVHTKVADVNCDELHPTECPSLLNHYLKQSLFY